MGCNCNKPKPKPPTNAAQRQEFTLTAGGHTQTFGSRLERDAAVVRSRRSLTG